MSDKRPFSALGKDATVTSVSIYSCVCVHVCAYWGCFIGLGTSLNNNGVVLHGIDYSACIRYMRVKILEVVFYVACICFIDDRQAGPAKLKI